MTAIHPDSLIVLDADGVFMNEMTYWRTALAAAFGYCGIDVRDGARWQRLDAACLQTQRLQFITKSRGCNSNWDLAAVIAAALSVPATRDCVCTALDAGEEASIARTLAAQMEQRWSEPAPDDAPLTGFGIDRQGDLFADVRRRFQDVLNGECDLGWSFPRHALAEPASATREALARMRDAGRTITICTSRQREETETPIRTLELGEFFDTDRMATYDEVRRAQRETGIAPLGKPHWFPLAAVALGYEQAVDAVRRKALSLPADATAVVFVGDAPADFDTARGCHALGLPVWYVHVDSGVTRQETLDTIANHEITVSVVPDLSAAATLVLGNSR